MGYNKVLLMLNDVQHEVELNPAAWWESCKLAFFALGRNMKGSFWGGQAVCEHHADEVSVIIAGGNYATVVGTTYNGNKGHHKDDDQIRILKTILEEKGYTITAKRRKTNMG